MVTVTGTYINDQQQTVPFTITGEYTIDTVIDWVESQTDWNGGQMNFDIQS